LALKNSKPFLFVHCHARQDGTIHASQECRRSIFPIASIGNNEIGINLRA
jgi:hypothetical protein